MSRPLSPAATATAPATAPARAGRAAAAEPFQQLEAVMLRQMLQSSGAFRGSDSPGAELRADLFVETLAEAVAKAGGLGIGRMLERQIGGAPAAASSSSSSGATHVAGAPATRAPTSHPPGIAATRAPTSHASGSIPATRSPMSQVSGTLGTVGTLDTLEDPNCDAPLPEDPAADSIDDYQPAPAALAGSAAARRSFSAGRALIRYRERAEVHGADHPSRPSGGK